MATPFVAHCCIFYKADIATVMASSAVF